MPGLLVVTTEDDAARVLPSLALLDHPIRLRRPTSDAVTSITDDEILVVDARSDLGGARSICQVAAAAGLDPPILLVLTEGGMAAVSPTWQVADVVLETAGPAEVAARVRLLHRAKITEEAPAHPTRIDAGELSVDVETYTARIRGEALNLTYTEFELLRHLAQHPGRVFTRAQLLEEVWGYDYYGGTRTVDVHIRRLRAKLGGEHDHLIGTVRNVGYRFSARPA